MPSSDKKKPASLSWFQRAMNSMKNAGRAIASSKLVTFIASGPVIRTFSIAMASFAITGLAIAGVSLIAPVSLPVAVAALALTTLSAAGGAIKDVYYTRDIRKLDEEHKVLVKNKDNISVEQQIFKIDPKLKKDLEGSLDQLSTDSANIGKSNAGIGKLTRSKSGIKVFAEVVAPTAINIATHVLNPVSITKSAGVAVISMLTGTKEQLSVDEKRHELKQKISDVTHRSGVPDYKNITELRQISRKQEIQTMALKDLVRHPDYFKMDSQARKENFNILKQQKEQELPLQGSKENSVTSIIKDIGRANNPFHKYSPSQSGHLKLSEKSPLSKSLDNIAKAKLENIADHLHHKHSAPSNRKVRRVNTSKTTGEKGARR